MAISEWTTYGQQLHCSNDANGNSRRLYVFYENNGTVAWICKEKNDAPSSQAAAWKRITELPTICITVPEWDSWLELLIERGYNAKAPA